MAQLLAPMTVLAEEPPKPSRRRALAASRTVLTSLAWRATLWLSDKVGRALRWTLVDGRAFLAAVAAIAAVILVGEGEDWAAGAAATVCVLLALGPSIRNAQRRVMVGDFSGLSPQASSDDKRPPVELGNLLQTELSRLGSLFRVVEDRRTVSSGLVASSALDATISVDEVVSALQDTVSAETKVRIGPVSIPVAPLMVLASRAFRAPRLTGSLHQDGDTLILTARQRGASGLSWLVTRDLAALAEKQSDAVPSDITERSDLSAMIRELALRIFTDLALGRDVRWEASARFVTGLESFRAALRTPQDRKVNLRRAEQEFLKALSEDEDFPVAYYNLGIVYTELHGLAYAGGRKQEERMHLNAAETSFKWAIEKEPQRWDTHLALAQTQFGHGHFDDVMEHCERIRWLTRDRKSVV
jgi:hypothetical protein